MAKGNNTSWKLFTSIFLLSISIALTPSYPKGQSERYGEKGCFSNIRVLRGAIEMYNMDSSTTINEINKNSIELLKTKGYLKNFNYPSECNYFSKGNLFNDYDSVIYCSYHGSIIENGIAKIPASKEYENEQKIKNEKMNKTNIKKLLPSLIVFITAIIVWFI